MKTFMCKLPFRVYNTELNKYTTLHAGSCFVSLSDGQANEEGMLLLHGIDADNDKKMWIYKPVFQRYFKPAPAYVQSQGATHPFIQKPQTMLEALYL